MGRVKLPGAYRVYILPVAGALLMVSGPLGYRATTKESKCMLGFFFVSLLAILVANMDIGIWVLSNKDKMRCCDPAAIDQLFFGMLQVIGVVGLLIAVMVLGIILIMLLYFVIKCLQKTKCTFAVERD
ncbi:CD9 antigen-like [Engraulis encrasicolus]|uniref:CD9 antigen-like n=1 Tax=Engraulis encrasicolus TaxID=184585 RepID=UPI002FD30783